MIADARSRDVSLLCPILTRQGSDDLLLAFLGKHETVLLTTDLTQQKMICSYKLAQGIKP